MLELKVRELDEMELAGPIVFAKKKESSLIYFVDYPNLNAVTQRNSNHIPEWASGLIHSQIHYYSVLWMLIAALGK